MLRRDVTLSNARCERLVASHWAVDDASKRPCVIFCHANSASRVQAVHYLALLLSLGCSVLALDFAGACSAPSCVEINQCVGCTRKFFTKSFPGDDTAVLAPSDGEESTLPRRRAGVASMAWRTTR